VVAVASMEYRRLGRSGLKVSQLSLGSWVTYHNQVDSKLAQELMATAFDAGVNFFDNAEVYANGESEVVMGKALRALGWGRLDYLVSTKLFWGLDSRRGKGERPRVNGQDTLNRKYLMQGIEGSLKRLQLEHVDLVFCHRPDPQTPIEETVWAMHSMIEQGKALYWGTSEWSAPEIKAACDLAERHHLHKPLMEQPEYNLFHRQRVELEYASLYESMGLGLTTWSPLASGLLTGKYNAGIPDGSRGSLPSMGWLKGQLTDAKKNAAVVELEKIAGELGASVAQLAIAWCTHNSRVSTVILGASKVSQLSENLQALDCAKKLTAETLARIDALTGTVTPEAAVAS
jgi:voltage-dependent potassium channel beta subunit